MAPVLHRTEPWGDLNPGRWSPGTSTVDFCEFNYIVTALIAEFWNTLSSFAMVIVGVLGVALHRRSLETRFLLSFALIAVVGFGSVAFHATLWREGQLADELPMLWVVLVYTYILIEDGPVKRFGWKLPAALFVHAIFITALATFSSGTLQFILFHASFAPPEFFSFYRIYRLYRRQTEAGYVAEGRIFRVGAACFVSGIVVWLFEMGFCEVTRDWLPRVTNGWVPNPQLHAWWHVLASSGLYFLTLTTAFDAVRASGGTPVIRWWCGAVPWCDRKAQRE